MIRPYPLHPVGRERTSGGNGIAADANLQINWLVTVVQALEARHTYGVDGTIGGYWTVFGTSVFARRLLLALLAGMSCAAASPGEVLSPSLGLRDLMAEMRARPEAFFAHRERAAALRRRGLEPAQEELLLQREAELLNAVGWFSAARRRWERVLATIPDLPLNGDDRAALREQLRSADLTEFDRGLRSHRLVIVQEDHQDSLQRFFGQEVLAGARRAGFAHLAIETSQRFAEQLRKFEADGRMVPHRHGDFTTPPDFSPFTTDFDYLQLIRSARDLGFRLHALEPATVTGDREQRIAENLAALLRKHPEDRVLVWYGAAHVAEGETRYGPMMAELARRLTGIDPFTIAQRTSTGPGRGMPLERVLASLGPTPPGPPFALRTRTAAGPTTLGEQVDPLLDAPYASLFDLVLVHSVTDRHLDRQAPRRTPHTLRVLLGPGAPDRGVLVLRPVGEVRQVASFRRAYSGSREVELRIGAGRDYELELYDPRGQPRGRMEVAVPRHGGAGRTLVQTMLSPEPVPVDRDLTR